ncbi:MAG: hypothetical protein GC159_01310 [Phycisphaera sp.]|nr:hypothetical protein [Phycisphaera sp.]
MSGRPPHLQVEKPDIDEHAANGQVSTTRLFMQLLAFGECTDSGAVVDAVKAAGIPAVVYEDVNDARGVALLTWAEDPTFFVTTLRKLLLAEPFINLWPKQDLTMIGRSYTLGHEPDIQQWLFDRPIGTATNPDERWAVWYPLRRAGAFEKLDQGTQRTILMEHAKIGMAYASADYAHDVRLVSTGLDRNDNDFVIGLIGKELHPLSAIVQAMRKTTQTSQYLESLGPFFVGHAVYQSKG